MSRQPPLFEPIAATTRLSHKIDQDKTFPPFFCVREREKERALVVFKNHHCERNCERIPRFEICLHFTRNRKETRHTFQALYSS